MKLRNSFFYLPILALGFIGCNDEDDKVEPSTPPSNEPTVTVPATYEFERNGSSSVSYSGQTERMDQLAELTVYMKTADAGAAISANTLKDMYMNQNSPFSFTSTKQLMNKTFPNDVDSSYFRNLMDAMAIASQAGANNDTAAMGKAGLLKRANGNTILVDENGREFTQLIEKGLMGATFYYQIDNVYLSDDKIGPQVDNSAIIQGKNYTAKEHHFDEAFGYFGAPIDFESNYMGSGDVRFWAKYSRTADDQTASNDKIMKAYKLGRKYIVEKNQNGLGTQVAELHKELEVLMAATAIHYANSTLNTSNVGDQMHYISELYAFTRALRYTNFNTRTLSQTQVNDLLENKIGDNYWNTTTQGLRDLIDILAMNYGLENVKTQL